MIFASLILLTWIPVAAVNLGLDYVLLEENSAPSIAVPDSQMAITNTPTMFKATCTDLDATDQLRLTWYWGDGALSVTDHQSTGGNFTALTAHTFKFAGLYSLTIWIDDQSELPDHNVSDQGFVENIPLLAYPPVIVSSTVDTLAPMTGQRVTFSATVTDPQRFECVVTFEFGDGNSTEVTQLLPNTTVTAQHTYQAPGVYSAFVYAFDGYLLSWPSASIAIEVIPASFSLALVPGWNLVCNPFINSSINASTLGLGPGDMVVGYNPVMQVYDQAYFVEFGEADFIIEESTGYWVYSSMARTLAFQGALPSAPQSRVIDVPYGGGWVLLGFIGLDATRWASDIVGMFSGTIDLVVEWNASVQEYTNTYFAAWGGGDFQMSPGMAYWVYFPEDGILTYTP